MVRRILLATGAGAVVAAFMLSTPPAPTARAADPEWAINATAIEACSCPMFCQCYFNTKPAGHHQHGAAAAQEHYCRANLAYKINKGRYGDVTLDGAKFWVVSDLGGDFSEGKMDWAVMYFDKAMTPPQRAGLQKMFASVFPVSWRSFTTAEASIDKWEYNNDAAHATMDGGKTAEVKLRRHPGNTNDPVVIKNLKYWGAPRNDGFILMPNVIEAYRVGPKAFEYKDSNGFLITIDMTSKDVPPKSGAM